MCVISAGVALASWGELNLSLFGLTSMLTSVVAESVRLVLTQHLLVRGRGVGWPRTHTHTGVAWCTTERGSFAAAQVGTSQQMHPFEGLMFIGSACTACLTVQVCAGSYVLGASPSAGGTVWEALWRPTL